MLEEFLTRTRDLIADPSRWCKGQYALDAGGSACSVHSELACRWCLEGAMQRAAELLPPSARDDAVIGAMYLICVRTRLLPHKFNDEADHADVVELLGALIEESHVTRESERTSL